MSIIKLDNAYAFIAGAIVARFTGFFPTVIMSAAYLYLADPTIFSVSTLVVCKTYVVQLITTLIK